MAEAACGRLNGQDRERNLHYPISLKEADFKNWLGKVKEYVGIPYGSKFEEVREKNHPWLAHLQTVKELSNTSKHWELSPPNTSASAVAFTEPGKPQQIVPVPDGYFDDHDSLEFWRSTRPLTVPAFTVISIHFTGLSVALAADPGTIFSVASRHVHEVIEAVEQVAGWQPPL